MTPIPFRAAPLLLVLAALARAQADGGAALAPEPVRISAGLFKSDAAGTKFTPFKAGKAPFRVSVRLYDGPTGGPLLDLSGLPWQEDTTVSAASAAPSEPSSGAFNDPSRIAGRMDLLLGASVTLPPTLYAQDAWFTTQVTTLSDGLPAKEYAESPRQPLGLRGLTAGKVLEPWSIASESGAFGLLEADTLRLPEGAVAGRVLTSDAQGYASWEPLVLPVVQGTAGSLAMFDSASSVTASLLSQTGTTVNVDGTLWAEGNLVANGAVISASLSTSSDILAGDDLIANDGIHGKALSVTNAVNVAAGTPEAVTISGGHITLPGDVSADDFLGDAAILTSIVTQDLVVGTAAQILMLPDGAMSTSASFSAGQDVTVGDDLVVGDVLTVGDDADVTGWVRAGGASALFAIADGDVAAKDDLQADDDLLVGDDAEIRGGFILSDAGATTEMTLRAGANMRFVKDNDQGGNFSNDFQWWDGGTNAGLGGDLQMQLKDGGALTVDETVSTGGADLAEWYPTAAFHELPPGSVVAVDPARPAHVVPAWRGLHEGVLGIVSTAPGALLGNGEVEGLHGDVLRAAYAMAAEKRFDLAETLEADWQRLEAARTDRVAVALSGRVPLRVDGSGGPIAPGDRLGLGAAPGLAARWAGSGPVVAIALEAWDGQAPALLAFVHLDWSPDARWQPLTAGAQPGAAPAAGELPAAPSGTSFFPAGFRELVVHGAGLTAQSQPVVTFFGDAGSRSWISERGPGWFVVALERPAAAGVELAWALAR